MNDPIKLPPLPPSYVIACKPGHDKSQLVQYARLAVEQAVAAEREACAQIADEFTPPGKISVGYAIRSRGKK
jgi:hypothetical protein